MTGTNLGPVLVVVSWVLAIISLAIVFMRYYVRFKIVRRFLIDDWIMILTLLLALGNNIMCTVSVHWGLGHHIQYLTPLQITNSIKYIYLCEFFSIMSPCFGRISYAILLLQILPPTVKRKRFLWTIIGLQFVIDVGTVIISFAQCTPITAFWGPEAKTHCWNPIVQQYTGYFQGSFCALVDLILAVFPASLFWSLHMKLRTKISLSVLMGLGIFAMISSIMKTIELKAIGEKGDPTFAMCKLAIWWTLEAYTVLIAASIPTLKPLMRGSQSTSSTKVTNSSKYHTLQSLNTRRAHLSGQMDGSAFSLNDEERSINDDRKLLQVPAKAFAQDGRDGINKTTTIEIDAQSRDSRREDMIL